MRLTEEVEAEIAELRGEAEGRVGEAKEKEKGEILRKVEDERVWKEEWMAWAKEDWYEQFGVGPTEWEVGEIEISMQEQWVKRGVVGAGDDA